MKQFKIFFIGFIGMISFARPTWAASPWEVNFPLSDLEREAATKIRELFKNHVYQLDRDMVTFHYQRANGDSDSGPVDANQITRSSADWGKLFFDPTVYGGDMEGPGHYVSTDASGSRTYGGSKNPQLYVFTLKAGTTILDGLGSLDGKEKTIKEIMLALDCKSMVTTEPRPGANVASWLGYFRNSHTESCRKAVVQAVAELHIQATIYEYAAANEFSGCRHSRSEALSIISPDALNENLVAYFSDQSAIDPSGIGGFVHRLYNEGLGDLSLLTSSLTDREIPARLADFTADASNYEKWKRKYIFKCGATWTGEDKGDNYQEAVYHLKDRDIQILVREVTNAYAIRATASKVPMNSYLILYRLRGFNEMLYQLAGFPSNLSKFNAWIDMMKVYDSNDPNFWRKLEGVSRFFDEDSSHFLKLPFDKSFLSALWNAVAQQKTKPTAIFSYFEKLGVGPKTTMLVLNNILLTSSAIPLVTGTLPLDPNKNYSELMTKNKATYMAYLRECLRQYKDPSLSMEQINAGSCGEISW